MSQLTTLNSWFFSSRSYFNIGNFKLAGICMCNNDQFYNILVNFEVIATRVLPKYTELMCEFDSVDNSIFWIDIFSEQNKLLTPSLAGGAALAEAVLLLFLAALLLSAAALVLSLLTALVELAWLVSLWLTCESLLSATDDLLLLFLEREL